MEAICIIGSPRQNGSTAYIVGRVIDGMKAAGAEVRQFCLGDLSIGYCQGCRECEASRRCIQQDDMDRLLEGILESDIVLLASPSYWGDVTGQMKVYIDRSLPLCNASSGDTPVPKGKVGVAVAVRAGRSRAENQHIIDTFAHYFGHLGIKMVGSLAGEGIDTLADMESRDRVLDEAYALGMTVAETLKAVSPDTN